MKHIASRVVIKMLAYFVSLVRRKMARLTIDQKKFIVESMIKTNSNVYTRRQFKKSFGIDISQMTVWRIHRKWNLEGTVHDLHKGRSGRPLTARVPDKITAVRNMVEADNKKSLRKMSAISGIAMTCVHTILKKDLKFKAYKPMLRQELKSGDREKRLEFCQQIEKKGSRPGVRSARLNF